jgi:drug/metabolite transporter (DMT)-like permease
VKLGGESEPASASRSPSFIESGRLSPGTSGPVLPYLWMVLGSFALASMGAIAHRLRGSCDWQVIVLARGCLQLLFAGLLAYLAGVSLLFWKPGILWVRSIAGGLGMVCMFYAYTRLPVAEALVLNNTFPVWVALLSWPLLKQFPTPAVWVALASAMTGIVLMQQPRLLEGNLAALAALASSLCTAIAMIALNRLQGIDARAIIVHFSTVAVLMCVASYVPVAVGGDVAVKVPSEDSLVLVAFLLLGVGSLALLAQVGITKAFTTGNAAKLSVVNLTQVVFALAFDVFCFDHSFDLTRFVGMALILVPTAGLMMERPAKTGPMPAPRR